MTETKLPPDLDPATQAVPAGTHTTEYRVALFTALGTLIGTFVLAAMVMIALILERVDIQSALILLGFLLVPGAPSAAYVARGYSSDRADLKGKVAQGAASVAVAEARGPSGPVQS